MTNWRPDNAQIAAGRLNGADMRGLALKGRDFRQADLSEIFMH